MINKDDIQENMMVVGSDGEHVGTVDKVEGDQIKLTKEDSENGRHNFIPCDMVESIDGETVTLSQSAEDAKSAFEDKDETDEVGSFVSGGM
jgi:hypothetical protein